MRLAELSRATGLSTTTVKYYLRQGVLHPGESESSTWASYDESHVRRARLVRALTEVAGLPMEAVRSVLSAVDDEGTDTFEKLGRVQTALPAPGAANEDPGTAASEQVAALVEELGWTPHRDSALSRQLAHALETVAALGFPASDELLHTYARAAISLADADIAAMQGSDADTLAEHVVIGTLLYEPVLLALRRLAHEASASRRWD